MNGEDEDVWGGRFVSGDGTTRMDHCASSRLLCHRSVVIVWVGLIVLILLGVILLGHVLIHPIIELLLLALTDPLRSGLRCARRSPRPPQRIGRLIQNRFDGL